MLILQLHVTNTVILRISSAYRVLAALKSSAGTWSIQYIHICWVFERCESSFNGGIRPSKGAQHQRQNLSITIQEVAAVHNGW